MGGSSSVPLPPNASVVFAPADAAKGDGDIRRNPAHKDKLVAYIHEDAKTLYEVFQRGVRLSGPNQCMGYRVPEGDEVDAKGKVVGKKFGAYRWLTYNQINEQVQLVGSALRHLNLLKHVEDMGKDIHLIGLYSRNRYEWVVAEQACNAYGGCTVPLYDTLGPEAVAFIVGQATLSTIVCSNDETPKLLKVKTTHAAEMATLTNIVQFEDVGEKERKEAESLGITLRSLTELMEVGRANKIAPIPPKPEDVATFCYTSGTTGNPKGAMLTHGNIVADLSAAFLAGIAVVQDDVHISYLPLAHMFERIVQAAVWMGGGSIGFYQGNTLKLLEDLAVLRPTLFPSVPRLFNKIYDRITTRVASTGGAKAALFNKGFETKRYWLARNYLQHGLWDKLVFGKVKASMGLERVRMLITGSAPIAGHVMEFFRVVFGVPFIEGYGQTECAAAATVTLMTDQATMGHVGGPLACNEVKLVSVDEMGYRVTDTQHNDVPCQGRGEVCYRGPNVFLGYFKQPDKTAEALDADGWLHSGDVGLWNKNGQLQIIDRKKTIFKLSQGEYVAPERIENILVQSHLIAQIFVHGDSMQSALVAIVVPEAEAAKTWAASHDKAGKSLQELCADPDFKKAIADDIAKYGKEGKLSGFEFPKALHLDHELWTVDNDILTPTFKLKRNIAKAKYQAAIDEMYASSIGVVAGRTGLKQGATGAGAAVAAAGASGAE